MEFRIVCTDKQYAEFVSQKRKRYRLMGILSICTVFAFGTLQKLGIDLVPNQTTGNVLTGIVLIGMFSWLIHSIYFWAEKTRMKESYLVRHGDAITYHMLKEGYTEFNSTCTYHTYYITQINRVMQTPCYYKVYGVIELTKSDDNNNQFKTRVINKVKIPKYFNGLDELINDVKSKEN